MYLTIVRLLTIGYGDVVFAAGQRLLFNCFLKIVFV
ncbi:hypothetical protein G5C68_12040 [Lacticaseibacillus paracasei]|nr:hypothetical protein G5C68_12040 [Lacticaseibacillus paracasei]